MFEYFLRRFHPYMSALHREEYEELAAMFSVSPDRVYKLAHGMKPENETDKMICQDLRDQGIIRPSSVYRA